MIKTNFGSLILFLFLMITSVHAQKFDGEFSMLRSDKGVVIVYNCGINSFTLDIECKDIKEIDSQDMIFLVDDKVIQLTPVPLIVFCKDTSKQMSDNEVLQQQQDFEVNFAKKLNGESIKMNSKKFTLPDGRLCNSWNYRMPRKKEDTSSQIVRKQFFLSTKLNEIILMLSSVATLKDNDKKIQDFLKKAMQGLMPSNINIDLEAYREKLKSGK